MPEFAIEYRLSASGDFSRYAATTMSTSDITGRTSLCPGCRLQMPVDDRSVYDGYYNCSSECWEIYGELLGQQFSNAVIFGHVHQMTVDSYALQHAGGPHPNKSIAIHLAGLYASFELGVHQMQIPRLLQRLADTINHWPEYSPPHSCGPLKAFEVALADDPLEHIARVKKWSSFVWAAWSAHHDSIAELVEPYAGKALSRPENTA